MADESLQQLPTNQNLDYHIITLFQRLESMRKDSHGHRIGGRLSSVKAKYNMQAEIRTLEFWRYVALMDTQISRIHFTQEIVARINFIAVFVIGARKSQFK